MSGAYFRPLVQRGDPRPEGAVALAGGPCWFEQVERLDRQGGSEILPASALPGEVRDALCAPRAPICGLSMDQPRLMGIINTTPDSFSDGGVHFEAEVAEASARQMIADGADILDIGGESTRPGADFVTPEDEIARTAPVIRALRTAGVTAPISIDTRKAIVAEAAFDAGATLFNDVTALSYDPKSLPLAARRGVPFCLMHAQGDPKTMQDQPRYDNVLLDVYDYLAERVDAACAAGLSRDQILVDPGIGFGKTLDHNLTLLRGLSLFHGLGCAILLGASRKRFIGTVTDTPQADQRLAGSLAVALKGARQGVQVLRVHDIKETRQALDMFKAL